MKITAAMSFFAIAALFTTAVNAVPENIFCPNTGDSKPWKGDVCNKICNANNADFNGNWGNDLPNKMSYCACEKRVK